MNAIDLCSCVYFMINFIVVCVCAVHVDFLQKF